MEPSGVDSNATAPEDSGTQDVPQAVLPSVTSTISGLPIAAVYAGAINPFAFNVPTKSRNSAFHRSQLAYRYAEIGMRNVYVPQRRGRSSEVVKQKVMEGTGEIFTDPLDEFKPQNFSEGRQNTAVGNGADDRPRRESAGKFRGTGKKAYKAQNKGNTEQSLKKQVRYTQG